MSVQDVSLSKTYRKSKTEIYALTKKFVFGRKRDLLYQPVPPFSSFDSSGPDLQA